MEQSPSQNDSRQTLAESLVELGTKAFDPNAEPNAKAQHEQAFTDLVGRTRTVTLLPALNALIQPGRLPEWLRTEFIRLLARLPLRADGVRATLEFVFLVHPSSTVGPAEAAVPHKKGANITHEALKMATQLLANPPSGVAPNVWFSGIAPQLLALLDGDEGYELTRAASYVIGFGILGRKSFGAPGAPGWEAFAQPMLGNIDPSLNKDGEDSTVPTPSDRDGDVIDLSKDQVLVSSRALSVSLHRLQALVISHPNPGLTRRLLGPIILPLWALSSWQNGSPHTEDGYCLPARNLLRIYLKIMTSADKLMPIIRNLLYNGPRDDGKVQWAYQPSGEGDIEVVALRAFRPEDGTLRPKWDDIGPKADALINLLESVATSDDISAVFLDLFSRWVSSRQPKLKSAILVKEDVNAADPMTVILESTVLRKMMEKLPEKLVGNPEHILELVEGILSSVDLSVGDDEIVATALSLLNLVITAPGFRKSEGDGKLLQSIEASLEGISKTGGDDISATARNLSLFLKYRDEVEDETTSAPSITDRQVEDRKTYNLAMSYITQVDSPPPVRSEGLNLIQSLIRTNSPVLDIPAILVLLSSLLDENEDYINLRVIQMFTQLANKHPKSVTKELLERYVDANETASVDTRLRFGEALLQTVQRLGETFAGETAQQVGEMLLATAGRRGHRPKTEAKQARDERLRNMKKRKANDIIGEEGDEEEEEDVSEEDKKRNEILNQIVEGWGSKRGSEDVRIRASALSIFATSIDTNIAGLGPTLVSNAVDLCINILTMETEIEKGILRRAAIILILSFVRALDKAKEERRRLGFGLTPQSQDDILRVLRYVAATDSDGLVKQHALDVVESLENWQLSSMIPEAQTSEPAGLTRLAGLTLNPGSLDIRGLPDESARPRIEEIE